METARGRHAARRCGCGLAARGGRAAAGEQDPSDRLRGLAQCRQARALIEATASLLPTRLPRTPELSAQRKLQMHLAERFSLGVARRTRRTLRRRRNVGPRRSSGATTTGPLAGQAVDPSSSPPYLTDMLLARTLPAGFIAPCLPMTAPRPPSGPLWLHEVKHDGFRIIARKDGLRVRLYSRQGNDLTNRFPLIVEAMERLPSCTLDGEGVACDDSGVASFNLLLHRKRDDHAFLFAFDQIAGDATFRSVKKISKPLGWRVASLRDRIGAAAGRQSHPAPLKFSRRYADRAQFPCAVGSKRHGLGQNHCVYLLVRTPTPTIKTAHGEGGQMVGSKNALLSAAKKKAPHIDWSRMPVSGPAIIGALPGRGSVLVCQYSANSYTLRHNGRMVRSDLTSIKDVCAAIDSIRR
jgi:hypothetical protein